MQLTGGYLMYDGETLGNGTEIRHIMDGNISVFPGVPADLNQPSGYVDNRSTSKTVTDKQERLAFNATTTWFTRAKGEHAIKAGARFERVGNTRDVGNIQIALVDSGRAKWLASDMIAQASLSLRARMATVPVAAARETAKEELQHTAQAVRRLVAPC